MHSTTMPSPSAVDSDKNSDVFLKIFSQIEKWLRDLLRAEKSVQFSRLVEQAAKSNRMVEHYKDDLKEYAALRNAIVHERTDGHVIAEPNEHAISHFRRIQSALLEPPKVLPQFKKNVKSLNEAISSAVIDMREGMFSQLPVLDDDKVIALLTSETVVRWLASEVKNELVSLMETQISAVLEHVEDKDHYCFLSKEASLHEAVSRFEDFTSKGKDLDAILITEGGRPEQALLGILTVYDLPAILKGLGLRRTSVT